MGPQVLVQLRLIRRIIWAPSCGFVNISMENGLHFIHIHLLRYTGHVLVTSAVTVRSSARSRRAEHQNCIRPFICFLCQSINATSRLPEMSMKTNSINHQPWNGCTKCSETRTMWENLGCEEAKQAFICSLPAGERVHLHTLPFLPPVFWMLTMFFCVLVHSVLQEEVGHRTNTAATVAAKKNKNQPPTKSKW